MGFIGSRELIRHFTDAKSVLMKNKAYGAYFSSFEHPGKHTSLNSFANTAGFSWCFDKRAIQRGDAQDAKSGAGDP